MIIGTADWTMWSPDILQTLRAEGIARGGVLTPMDAREVLAYLQTRPQWIGHTKREGRPAIEAKPRSTCWGMDDVITAPHLLELAIASSRFAQAYLEVDVPCCYSLNAFTTYPGVPIVRGIHELHRDHDDERFLGLFVYLTDVPTRNAGAHVFVNATHRAPYTVWVGGGTSTIVVGPPGYGYFADTRGLHYGVQPTQKPRTMAWVRWGVSDPPPAYIQDKLAPVDKAVVGGRYPEDPWLQEVLRWVVR